MNPGSLSSPRATPWREILCWCLPALLVGLALRIALIRHMPLAFFSGDTNEFLGSRLLGGSRTFLPKLIYGAPVRLGLPLLPSIAFLQHFFGLLLIPACGFLCAQWLRAWRWWIVPFTAIMAVHPTLLWYEHFVLPDSTFTLLVVLTCLAGTHFYRRPTAWSLGLLGVALVLTAGARQEGFLFLAFGLALIVRVYWSDGERLRVVLPTALVLSLVIALLTRTNQGGYMLLTSLVQWAPDRLWSEPGLSPRMIQLRERFRSQWPAYPEDHNDSRKLILAEVEDYLEKEHGVPAKQLRERSAALCQTLALEMAMRNFWRLPGLAFNKFRAMHLESPAPDFAAEWAHDKHLLILFGKPGEKLPKEHRLMTFYLGGAYASRDELAAALPQLYRVLPGDWLSRFQKEFYGRAYAVEMLPRTRIGPQTLPGLPIIYFLSFAGFVAILLREGRTLSEKQLWIAMLLFQAFVIALTGSLRSRYRLSFEPWLFLGVFAFLDAALRLALHREATLPAQDTRSGDSTAGSRCG